MPAHGQGTAAMPTSMYALEDDVSTDAHECGVHTDGPIYSHGYGLRVALTTRGAALEALRRIGWSPKSPQWQHAQLKHGERWIVRGSTYVTHRKPRNKGLAMAQLNAEWKTNLYSLIVEDDGEGIAVTFHGVRRTDVEKVLTDMMGLGPDDYRVDHYTALERYFVLPPHEAYRLAAALDGHATNGAGRASRKRYLLRDHPFSIIVGKRARRTPLLTVYRLGAGATAQFKVELRLKGRSRDRQQFTEGDLPRLDALLQAVIDEHDLTPIPKPARWEPVTPHGWRRDGNLALVSWKAYRGKAVDQSRVELAQECHTPCLAFWTDSPDGSLTYAGTEYIRSTEESRSHSPILSAPVRGHRAWRRIAEDIDGYEGYLSEVILDPNQDPAPLVEALIDWYGDRVGIGSISDASDGSPDTWGSVTRLAAGRPLTMAANVWVILIDFSVVQAIEAQVLSAVGDSLTETVPGRLCPGYWQPAWAPIPPWEKAVAALLSPIFGGYREAAETTGLRIVTITTDLRPQHGRGALLRTHLFRDGRVRSHVGDAGRYYAHLRYLVDSDVCGRPRRVVMAKDEGEGLPGRMLWG